MSASNEDIPSELVESFEGFSTMLGNIEEVMKRLVQTPRNKLLQDLTPVEVAKLDLVSAYSINSLFWMYLIMQGVNPRKHEIKGELERIKSYMGKVKEIEDRGKAPKLQKETAKRFVRSAMFDLENKKKEESNDVMEDVEENDTEVARDEKGMNFGDEFNTDKKGKSHKGDTKSKSDRKRLSGHKSHKQMKKKRANEGKQKWHGGKGDT